MLQHIVDALGVDRPIPVGRGDALHGDLLADAFELERRGALFAGAVEAVGRLPLIRGDEGGLVVIDTHHVVARRSGGDLVHVARGDDEFGVIGRKDLVYKLHGALGVGALEGPVHDEVRVERVVEVRGMAVGVRIACGIGRGDDVHHADTSAEPELGIELAVAVHDASVREQQVVLALDGALDVEAVAGREVALDVLGVGKADELVDGEPVGDLSKLAKAELGVADERIDGVAVQPVAAVEQRLGAIEVMKRYVGRDAVALAAGEQLMVMGDTLGDGLGIVTVREDARPRDRDADGIDAVLGGKADVFLVAMVEIAGGIGKEPSRGDEIVVPHGLALAGDAGGAFGLVGSGGGPHTNPSGSCLTRLMKLMSVPPCIRTE